LYGVCVHGGAGLGVLYLELMPDVK